MVVVVDKSDKYSRTYFDLLEALRQPDCAICRLVGDALTQYIDMFIYENINNIARREEIRAGRGFCSVHTTAFMSGYGRLLSLATLEQDVLNDVLRQIDQALGAPNALGKSGLLGSLFQPAAKPIRAAIQPRGNCPLCDYERSQEIVMLGTLIQFIDDAEMQAAFERSAGLCLPHYYVALGLPGKLDRIVAVEQAMLKQLKHDVDEYVHKRNPMYADEQMGEESDAPSRAAKVISGRIVHTDGRW